MPATAARLLDAEQELHLLLKLLRTVRVLARDEEDLHFVGRVLNDRERFDQLHEVPGLVELPDVRVGDRDLGGTAQVREKQGVVRDAALVLLELAVALEQRRSAWRAALLERLRRRPQPRRAGRDRVFASALVVPRWW